MADKPLLMERVARICYLSPVVMNSDKQAIFQWKSYRKEFVPDGSLRDIVVTQTAKSDWCEAMGFIAKSDYEFSFSGKLTGVTMPESIGSLFPSTPEEELALLSISVSKVLVNCHFFSEAEIEFDIDPQEVSDGRKLAALFDFMRGLANSVRKQVLMTPENVREHAIFRCQPDVELIEYRPFFNGALTSVVFGHE